MVVHEDSSLVRPFARSFARSQTDRLHNATCRMHSWNKSKMESTEPLNEFEARRRANMAKIKSKLLELRLGVAKAELEAHARGRGRGKENDGAPTVGKRKIQKTNSVSKRGRGTTGEEKTEGDESMRRRSSRLRGAAVGRVETGGEEETKGEDEVEDEERRALHETAAAEYAKRHAGKQERATIVGTASYQHTLMRVRTMDEAALGRRIAAIERAKGKHAVIKMRLFARVLFLEGHEWLASDAAEALERLIDELGDPEADEIAIVRTEIARDAAEARDAGDGEFHCDAATDLSLASVYADVVRVEAMAMDEEFTSSFKSMDPAEVAKTATPNATIWQAAAARLAKSNGLLASGNVLSLQNDGTYHIEPATAEMKAAIRKTKK